MYTFVFFFMSVSRNVERYILNNYRRFDYGGEVMYEVG